MEFNGPDAADLRDVRSLNRAFLRLLRGRHGATLRVGMPASLQRAVAALADRQIERLAEAPFLLLSLRESDESFWARLLNDAPAQDLFAPARAETHPVAEIASAAVGFVWQLAKKNPYTARLISGGTISWCEQLAATTLLDVLQRAVASPDIVGPRLAADRDFWHRLLGAGMSSERAVRQAAHLCALQTVLAPGVVPRSQRFRSAACYSTVPALVLREGRQRGDDDAT